MERETPIMIFGLPRSGTSWLAETIAEAENIEYIVEPDNEGTTFLGYYYKRGLNRFPFFTKDEEPENYLRMFDRALKENYITHKDSINNFLFKSNLISLKLVKTRLFQKKKNRRLVLNLEFLFPNKNGVNQHKRRLVKTVHSILNLPLLMTHLEFIPLIIIRHPAATISSYIKMNNPDGNQQLFQNEKLLNTFLLPYKEQLFLLKSELSLMGAQIGIFHFIISNFVSQYNYKIIFYEDLCVNPKDEFKNLFQELNLNWNQKIENFINDTNKSGKGYEIKRIAADQRDIWKEVWSKRELEEIRKGYFIFPKSFYDF